MTINDRIQLIIDELFEGSTNKLAEAIGVKPSVISGYTGKRQSKPSYDVMKKLVTIANLSPAWLLTGVGKMKNIPMNDSSIINDLHISKCHDSTIKNQSIPLYAIEATASILAQGDIQEYIVDYLQIPNMPKCDGAVSVVGDSMYPIIKSGDIVLYKAYQDLTNIIWGQIYLITLIIEEDSLILIKYIKKVDNPEHILLVSHNQHHAPMEVPLSCVRSIALVKASIRYHTMI